MLYITSEHKIRNALVNLTLPRKLKKIKILQRTTIFPDHSEHYRRTIKLQPQAECEGSLWVKTKAWKINKKRQTK